LPLWRSGRNRGPVDIGRVTGALKISPQARRRLRVDRQRVAATTLAGHAQRVIAAVLVQIAHLERGDLGAPQADLQADGEDRAIAQAGDRVLRRRVKQLARLRFRKARVEPSSRLIAGRSTSPTGLRAA
jgi:hypothetical protein